MPPFHLDERLDTTSRYTAYATLATLPLVSEEIKVKPMFTLAAMYAEAALLSFGIKDLIKAAVGRARPYTRYDETPAELISDIDAHMSFPSGHATMAFMTAAFSTFSVSSCRFFIAVPTRTRSTSR